MMNLRMIFLFWVAVVCQVPSHIALATSLYRLDAAHFSLRLDPAQRFLSADETTRIMINDWGNPAQQVADMNPLGMIVDQSFPEGSNWGIVITASFDGHVSDQDAKGLEGTQLLQRLRKEYLALNRQRKAAGAAAVTSFDWAQLPQYDGSTHQIRWAHTLGFGKPSVPTLNFALRILGREQTIHLNAVGRLEQRDAIARAMEAVASASSFDAGFRYRDYNPRLHRKADYGLVALVAGQPLPKLKGWQKLWQTLDITSPLIISLLFGCAVGLGRWVMRPRLPEF